MRLRELKKGTQICPEIRLDSLLDTHHGISLYLASDTEYGHALVHVLPDFEGDSLKKLENAAEFYVKSRHLKARCGRYEEFLFFSEPFPLGEFMFEWLERRGRVGLAEALKRVIGLLKLLEQAREKGITHGRITPKLVLMERTSDAVELRLMGLGVANAMTESMQCDIDWFDYTFDLEGMEPVAIDIYGIAIILMGLVSGESGIDSFEATGLLPQMFRGGMLQQVMEKALALRMDAYPDILTFTLDLEAAMLEVDEKRGEVYVGDLVGFESAVKSITNVSDENPIAENSGVWNSLFDTLEQEERSSLLYSLTSLPAIRPIDDEDEDVTRVTSIPNAVLSTRRIRSSHADKTVVTSEPDKTEIITRPKLSTLEEAHQAEIKKTQESDTETQEKNNLPENSEKKDEPAKPMSPEERLADLKSLEDELKGDDDEEEDDAPTRVMMRPNYFSIQFGQESQGVDSSIAEVIEDEDLPGNTIAGMTKRIQNAVVSEFTMQLGHDVTYAPDDPVAFPPEDEIIPGNVNADSPVQAQVKSTASSKHANKPHTAQTNTTSFSHKQRQILLALIGVVFILAIVAITIAIQKNQSEQIVEPDTEIMVPENNETQKTTPENNNTQKTAPENNDTQKTDQETHEAENDEDFVIGEQPE